MNYPRVLVTSIDVWNSESGSDTFTNLLSGYKSSKVANIYFRSGIPTSKAAENYFYISENDVIRSIFNKKIRTGKKVEVLCSQRLKNEIDKDSRIQGRRLSFFRRHRNWAFLIARELLWKIGNWNSMELNLFIEEFDPEILFCPIEGYIHFNRINEHIINKRKIPLITYIWDDNFSYRNCQGIGERIYRLFLHKGVNKLLRLSDQVFVISKKMQEEIKAEFNIDAEILTKGAIHSFDTIPMNKNKFPIEIVYTGKLVYGRLDSLIEVCKIVNEMNKERDTICLKIYSGTQLTDNELKYISGKGIQFCGSVSQDQISDIQKKADVLLMLEALNGKHKYDARLSFSTKVVDYLAQGKCIVAVAPNDIASTEYLKNYDAALCASSENEIYEVLEMITKDSVREYYSKQALKLVKSNHDLGLIQKKLYRSFSIIKG